jgi:DNA-directed RNA polymerase subunit RPC12/RpoP
METRIFHGKFSPSDLARIIIAQFHRGNYIVQQIGEGDQVAVQIASSRQAASGGQTALSVSLQRVEDGVAVQIGRQAWYGVAASLGLSALAALVNPWNLLGRLDDIAQDVESFQLSDEIWKLLEVSAQSFGTGFELTNRLKRTTCAYCGVANPVGEPSCIACGAPLGEEQPVSCQNCGFVIRKHEKICPNCGSSIR